MGGKGPRAWWPRLLLQGFFPSSCKTVCSTVTPCGGVAVMSGPVRCMCSASSRAIRARSSALAGCSRARGSPGRARPCRLHGGSRGSDEIRPPVCGRGWRAFGWAPCPGLRARRRKRTHIYTGIHARVASLRGGLSSSRQALPAAVGANSGLRAVHAWRLRPRCGARGYGPQGGPRVAALPLPRRGGGRDA